MTRIGSACALGLLLAACGQASEVVFLFEDPDYDETFNVSVRVAGSYGLASYQVALAGLDATPLDPAAIVWEENVLSTVDSESASRGFTGGLQHGPIGTHAYSALNTQFLQNAVFGVGQRPILIEAHDGAPDETDVDLAKTALLGRLTIPGANGLAPTELESLLTPDATIFTIDGDSSQTGAADSLSAHVVKLTKFYVADPPDPPTPPPPAPSSVIIDFNAAVGVTSDDGVYREDGVTMSVVPHPINGDVGEFAIGEFGFDQTGAVVVDGDTGAVTFTAGGAPFSLHSLDLPPAFFATDTLHDLSILTSTGFERELTAGRRESFSGPDFTAITSFTLMKNRGSDPLEIDNLVITIIPEPAAGTPLLLVLAATVSAARRRR